MAERGQTLCSKKSFVGVLIDFTLQLPDLFDDYTLWSEVKALSNELAFVKLCITM